MDGTRFVVRCVECKGKGVIMTNYFNTIQDFRNYISDQPLCCPEMYVEEYVNIVADELFGLCVSKGFEFGDELPEIEDEEFWECFKVAELPSRESIMSFFRSGSIHSLSRDDLDEIMIACCHDCYELETDVLECLEKQGR